MVLFDSSDKRRAGRGPGGAATRSPLSALERWTLFVLRNRRSVLALWLAVLAAGIFLAFQLPAHLVNSFSVPGTASARAESALADGFR